jgi:tetratricopeptide (TPR) repeat protein
VVSSFVLVALLVVCASCGQSDETEKEDKLGINAQVIEALRTLQSRAPDTPLKGPDGPMPKSAAEYINLSLQYYNEGEWEKCIEACIGALNFDPSSAVAYNNICSAYIQLRDFDRAILACNKALALQPDYQRARNNLNSAIEQGQSN